MPAHLINTKQIDRAWMEGKLFPLAEKLRETESAREVRNNSPHLAGRALYCLFYEPSFLTRTSFERAMSLLGGHVQFTEDASQFFPVQSTSYIEDTIKFLGHLHFDCVVLRSSQPNAAQAAAGAEVLSVINGGSDTDHPTQALLDMYTLQRELGGADGLTIAVVGRVDHRNVNALLVALAMYRDVTVVLCPFTGQPDPEVLEYCQATGMSIRLEQTLTPFADSLDAVYLNGAETAAHMQLLRARNLVTVRIDRELMGLLKPHCVILDPMQRTEPLITDNADARWAGYRQAENGLFVRMALLLDLLRDH